MNRKDILEKLSGMDEKKFTKYYRAEDIARQLVLKAVPIISQWIDLDTKNITITDVMTVATNKSTKNIYDMIWSSLKYKYETEVGDKGVVIANYWCFYRFYKMAKGKDISPTDVEFFTLFVQEIIKILTLNQYLMGETVAEDIEGWYDAMMEEHDKKVNDIYNTHSEEIRALCENVMMLCDVCWKYDCVGSLCTF